MFRLRQPRAREHFRRSKREIVRGAELLIEALTIEGEETGAELVPTRLGDGWVRRKVRGLVAPRKADAIAWLRSLDEGPALEAKAMETGILNDTTRTAIGWGSVFAAVLYGWGYLRYLLSGRVTPPTPAPVPEPEPAPAPQPEPEECGPHDAPMISRSVDACDHLEWIGQNAPCAKLEKLACDARKLLTTCDPAPEHEGAEDA